MTEFSSRQIPPPQGWEEFESLCCDLWTEIWSDKNTSKNGRGGQAQHGVDVFGRENGNGSWLGIQCKGKDGRYGKAVTEAELRSEVNKALKFRPKIASFILATTAENDAKIQKVARELTEGHKAKGLFSVTVIGWGEIIRRLADHEHLIEKYYSGQSQRLKGLESSVSELTDASLLYASRQAETHELVSKLLVELTELKSTSSIVGDGHLKSASSDAEVIYNEEIDSYRDMLRAGKSRTAKQLLEQLKARCWDKVSDYIKFRLITNIASCQLRLGDDACAISGFIEAYKYAGESEIANANLVLADILNNDLNAAYEKALNAVEKFPENKLIISHLIASHPVDDEGFNPSDLIPESLEDSGEVAFSVFAYYQKSENSELANAWLAKAYALDPTEFGIRASYSSEILASFSADQSVLIGGQLSKQQYEKLNECNQILRSLYDELLDSEELRHLESIANNLAFSYRVLGNVSEAQRILDAALVKLPNSEMLIKLKAALLVEHEEYAQVIELIDALDATEDFQTVMMKVEALRGINDYAEAINCIEKYIELDTDSEAAHADLLSSLLIEFKYELEGYESSIAYSEKFTQDESSTLTFLAVSKIHRREGNIKAAQECTAKLLSSIDETGSYGERFEIAEEAYFCDLLSEAKDLFRSLAIVNSDSPSLRRLTACLYELDDRKGFIEHIESLPEETRTLPFYVRYCAAFYSKVGNDKKAEREIDKYLEAYPSDLNMALNKVGIMCRTNRRDEVPAFVANLVDVESQSIIDQMHLAYVHASIGNADEALKLAYRLRRESASDPSIHSKYVGLIFSGDVSSAIDSPSQVTAQTSITVEDQGELNEYYILGENEYPNGDYELNSEHPISVSAMGARIGDKIEYQINPVTSKTVVIREIKSKYIYLLHETMNRFSHRFPTENSMFKLDLKKEADGDLDIAPIFQSIDRRKEYIEQGLSLYEKHPMPVAMLAKYFGVDPIELWVGMQSGKGQKIICSQGTHTEREKAFEVIQSPKQYVVDPLTAFQLMELGVIDIVEQVLGRLSITQSSIDSILEKIEREGQSAGQPAMTLERQGDKYVRREITEDDQAAKLEYLKSIHQFFINNFNLVEAIGSPASTRDLVQFMSNADAPYIDTIYASANEGFALLSDDLRLRGIAQSGWSIDAVWVQPVLMVALKRKLMTNSRYAETIHQYILRNFTFISIDKDVLYAIASEDNFRVSDRFRVVSQTMGAEYTDVLSSLNVFDAVLDAIRPNCRDIWIYESFVYALLNSLTANCTSKNTALLVHLLSVPIARAQPGPFLKIIQKWASGHFLTSTI